MGVVVTVVEFVGYIRRESETCAVATRVKRSSLSSTQLLKPKYWQIRRLLCPFFLASSYVPFSFSCPFPSSFPARAPAAAELKP